MRLRRETQISSVPLRDRWNVTHGTHSVAQVSLHGWHENNFMGRGWYWSLRENFSTRRGCVFSPTRVLICFENSGNANVSYSLSRGARSRIVIAAHSKWYRRNHDQSLLAFKQDEVFAKFFCMDIYRTCCAKSYVINAQMCSGKSSRGKCCAKAITQASTNALPPINTILSRSRRDAACTFTSNIFISPITSNFSLAIWTR